jgi:hypothetical protein
MGEMVNREFANLVGEGAVSLESAVRWHLRHNHYPAVHEVFVETAIQAIRAVNGGRHDEQVEMPNGVWKSHWEIVEGLHLGAFINDDE